MFWTIALLFLSNVFMTFAWYGHLKNLRGHHVALVILISWGIAFFEYCLQVPANRIGAGHFSIAELRVIQEIISLVVFATFLSFYMGQPLKLDYLWAGLCLVGAAYFIFRDNLPSL